VLTFSDTLPPGGTAGVDRVREGVGRRRARPGMEPAGVRAEGDARTPAGASRPALGGTVRRSGRPMGHRSGGRMARRPGETAARAAGTTGRVS